MGQGMNVSMQDAYNLGWKLSYVLEGASKADILSTYNTERRPVAEKLLQLDKQIAEFYSRGPIKESEEFRSFRASFSAFISGVAVTYKPSQLIASPHGAITSHAGAKRAHLAKNVRLGQRLGSYNITSQASGNVLNMSDLLPSTGAWRIVVFPGDLQKATVLEKLKNISYTLGKHLGRSARLSRFIQVITIHSAPRNSVDILDHPAVYHPWDETLG